MKTVFRAVVTIVALTSIALAGASSVRAADPSDVPVIGGDLEAFTNRVVVTSRSTNPVSVTMTAPKGAILTPSSFNLESDETITLAVTGVARGRVSAYMVAITPGMGDTSGVVLEVSFPLPALPEFPIVPVLGGLLALATFVVVAHRVRRFAQTHTIIRKET